MASPESAEPLKAAIDLMEQALERLEAGDAAGADALIARAKELARGLDKAGLDETAQRSG